MALAALALVVFCAYDSYPFQGTCTAQANYSLWETNAFNFECMNFVRGIFKAGTWVIRVESKCGLLIFKSVSCFQPVALAVVALFCASSGSPDAVANQTEGSSIPIPDALSSEDLVTSLPDADSALEDDDEETSTQETSTEAPELAEALPVAQPLVMDISLEDVDYMTVLRPPPLPIAPGSRPGAKGRKKTKQKRRRRPDAVKRAPADRGSLTPVPMNLPANPGAVKPSPVNQVPEVHYHRGYPEYADDEQRKSRERAPDGFSLQHVDDVPFALDAVMQHVASLGDPQYHHNHKVSSVNFFRFNFPPLVFHLSSPERQ